MKRIIKNKVYDTKTARRLASNSYSNPRDFDFWEETLYQKKTGEYFLHGEGGPRSRYAEQVSINTWSGGERIIPVTEEEAREWAEKNLDGDEYESIFDPIPEEDTGKRMLTVYIGAAYAEHIRQEARRRRISQGDYIEALLREAGKVF